jgi:hypothetical protein
MVIPIPKGIAQRPVSFQLVYHLPETDYCIGIDALGMSRQQAVHQKEQGYYASHHTARSSKNAFGHDV